MTPLDQRISLSTECIIESTCLYEIVEALDTGRPDGCHEWSWTGAVEATCALAWCDQLRMAPSPTQDRAASGKFGLLMDGIADVAGIADVSESVAADARRKTARWAKEHIPAIRDAYENLRTQEPAFPIWLDWFSRNVWQEHSQRLGGLFDPGYIPATSQVIGIPEADLRGLWKRTLDPKQVGLMARGGQGQADFDTISAAYVVSALIRGRYHANVGAAADLQVWQHPLRDGLLSRTVPLGKSEVPVPSTLVYLANTVLASAFEQRRDQRLQAWLDNVRILRRETQAGNVDLQPKRNDDKALEAAVDAARKMSITVHSRTLDRALGVGTDLGVGVLTALLVQGWEAVVAGAAAVSASALAGALLGDPAHKVLSVVSARRRRISRLANAGPGAVGRIWTRHRHPHA